MLNQRYIPTSVPGLVRDMKTNAIINMNKAELDLYKSKLDQNKSMEQLRKEVDDLKSLLTSIVKSGNL